jgi:hypothetical protein
MVDSTSVTQYREYWLSLLYLGSTRVELRDRYFLKQDCSMDQLVTCVKSAVKRHGIA